MLVNRGVSTSVVFLCLLLAITGVDAVHQLQRSRERFRAGPSAVPPVLPAAVHHETPTPIPSAQFKQEAEEQAHDAAKAQAELEQEVKLLDLQQKQHEALLRLKAVKLAREQAESKLLHNQLIMAHREMTGLVSDLATHTQNKMLIDLQRLYKEMAIAMVHRETTWHSSQQQPSTSSTDPKFKQSPSGSTDSVDQAQANTNAAQAAVNAANNLSPTQKTQLTNQLTETAEEVIDAQLNAILNSEELAYIKAQTAAASSSSSNTDVTEVDTTAAPGETPDQHLQRLMSEADALMAKAYPAIHCMGSATPAASSTAAASSGGPAPASSSTASSAPSLSEVTATGGAGGASAGGAAAGAGASAGGAANGAGAGGTSGGSTA